MSLTPVMPPLSDVASTPEDAYARLCEATQTDAPDHATLAGSVAAQFAAWAIERHSGNRYVYGLTGALDWMIPVLNVLMPIDQVEPTPGSAWELYNQILLGALPLAREYPASWAHYVEDGQHFVMVAQAIPGDPVA